MAFSTLTFSSRMDSLSVQKIAFSLKVPSRMWLRFRADVRSCPKGFSTVKAYLQEKAAGADSDGLFEICLP